MKEIKSIRVRDLAVDPEGSREEIIDHAVKKLRLRREDVLAWQIRKESVDARRKDKVKLVYTLDIQLTESAMSKLLSQESGFSSVQEAKAARGRKARAASSQKKETGREVKAARGQEAKALAAPGREGTSLLLNGVKAELMPAPEEAYHMQEPGEGLLTGRPVVTGFGPCGIFAALILAEAGYQPIVLERGRTISQRSADTERFWQSGALLAESNALFGEGGAGAFSDGKLTTQISDPRISKVLRALAEAGAPAEILFKQKPHIGTDRLREVVAALRERILRLGGEIHFGCRLTEVRQDQNGRLREVLYTDSVNGQTVRLQTSALVLAAGHSARDTFELLLAAGVRMEPKPFSMGVRVEHTQAMIDAVQYGSYAGHPRLGAAEYKLSHRCANGRGVYTFCMCPGGQVIASASEEGGLVTNGMSYHSRSGRNANSAVLVDVMTEDFGSTHPLAGLAFQRQWEQSAYRLGGGGYTAPVQRLGDFMGQCGDHAGQLDGHCGASAGQTAGAGKDPAGNKGRTAGIYAVSAIQAEHTQGKCDRSAVHSRTAPTYRPGVRWVRLEACLPDFVTAALREGIPMLGKKLRGFDSPDAVLTAIESRSSSPVRICRDDGLQSSIAGIYPAGEGAGYAGGITSAAVDGIKAAEQIIKTFAPPRSKA